VLAKRLACSSRDLLRRLLGQRGRARVPPRGEKREQSGSERCDQVSEERHQTGCGGKTEVPPVTTRMFPNGVDEKPMNCLVVTRN
jgi:hypothetical protein